MDIIILEKWDWDKGRRSNRWNVVFSVEEVEDFWYNRIGFIPSNIEWEPKNMPTLNWVGKEKVVNHHLDVPFRTLERQYTFAPSGVDDGNMIIHGDNLEALKALLPEYEGRVKCIYIDPPYNTGNEGWIYNDNVNDPRIRKWLGRVVGKEGEDFSRHDKWLCMMYPRLRLLQKLLAEDGAIFISIDDAEYASLKQICDEIFGNNCFVSNIAWQRTYSTRNDSTEIVNEVEHVLCYSARPGWNPKKLARTAEMDSKYKNIDNDIAPWRSSDAFAPGAATHQGMVYAIQNPFSGEMIYPYSGSCWRYQQETMIEIMNGWTEYELKDLNDTAKRASVCQVSEDSVRQGVKGIILSKPLTEARADAEAVLHRGQWPRFFFSKNGKGGIARKTYHDSVGGRLPTNLWPFKETGHTDEAKKEMISIFDGHATFDTPKPVRLIEFILRIASDPEAIILDSFAGSGTTAHAVLSMNKADGGHRRFILVEMNDYAESITAERVRRVISGYKKDEERKIFDVEITAKNLIDGPELLEQAKAVAEEAKGKYSKVSKPKIVDGHLQVIGTQKAADQEPGIPGSFSFYELGVALFTGDVLNPDAPLAAIRSYVFYTETHRPLPAPIETDPYLLGVDSGTAYYFCYQKDGATILDHALLSTLKTPAEKYIIYADLNALNDEELKRLNITFKKIPRDIPKL